VDGECNIRNGSVLEIAFPQEQFKDGLGIKIIFYNKNNNNINISCNFNNNSISQEIKTDSLKKLLNNSSEPIKIKLA
jgi:hypothetical protein